jgi:hypothetical protein
VRARDAGDQPGQARALVAVWKAIGAVDGVIRSQGVRGADLDDVRNRLLYKLLGSLPVRLNRPLAWARTVARTVALDWLRRHRRHGRCVPLDPEQIQKLAAREPEAEADPRRPDPGDLARAAEDYARRADGQKPPRGHQIRAWHALRVRRISALDFAAGHAGAGVAPAEATVWQWAKRGAALVRKLAAEDEDPVRADLMRRAAGPGSDPPRGPSRQVRTSERGGPAPSSPGARALTPAFGEGDRRALLFYAFTSALHRSTGLDRVTALRSFARVLEGAAPVSDTAVRGAQVAGSIALDDPDETRGDRMADLARHVLAQAP